VEMYNAEGKMQNDQCGTSMTGQSQGKTTCILILQISILPYRSPMH